jgi:hypothetical protein
MAAVMKVNKNLIARIWKEADLKPHRLERYMASHPLLVAMSQRQPTSTAPHNIPRA